jgi:hypothetical protein
MARLQLSPTGEIRAITLTGFPEGIPDEQKPSANSFLWSGSPRQRLPFLADDAFSACPNKPGFVTGSLRICLPGPWGASVIFQSFLGNGNEMYKVPDGEYKPMESHESTKLEQEYRFIRNDPISMS